VKRFAKVTAYFLAAAIVFLVTAGLSAQMLLLPRAKAAVTKDLKALYNPEELEVSFGTRAFLADMVSGKLPSLSVRMNHVDTAQAATASDRFISPVNFSEVSFVLSDVHFDRRRVMGGVSAFESERGQVTARLEQSEFNRFLRAEGFAITVTLAPGDVSVAADVSGDGSRTLHLSARALLEISDTMLTLEPKAIDQKGVETSSAKAALSAVLPIPPIAGIRARSVETFDGYMLLSASVNKLYGEEPSQEQPPGFQESELSDASPSQTVPASPKETSSPPPTRKPTPSRTPSPTPSSVKKT